MAQSSETLVKMGFGSTLTKTGRKIIFFLLNDMGSTQEEIRSLLHNKKEATPLSKQSQKNIVSNYILAYEKLGYIIKNGEKKRISRYPNWKYSITPKLRKDLHRYVKMTKEQAKEEKRHIIETTNIESKYAPRLHFTKDEIKEMRYLKEELV